jgi:hypothetical protein
VLDRFAGADSRTLAGTAACKEDARAGADGGSGPAFGGSRSGCAHRSARSDRAVHPANDGDSGTLRNASPYDGGPHHGQSLAEPFGFQPGGGIQLEQAD